MDTQSVVATETQNGSPTLREATPEEIANSALHTDGLSKVYKDFWGRDKVCALDDLNLTINRGEVFGLLGPNGSGKSTTIKLLLGLIFPTAGTAHVLGERRGARQSTRRSGFCPRNPTCTNF